MRTGIAILFCLCFGLTGAQQVAQYTQYVFNHFSVNPAVAGSKDCMEARLGYRTQWVGFDDAPKTSWASLQGTIKRKGKPFERTKHGIGAFVETDEQGVLGYSQFYIAYAYHLPVGPKKMLSLGVFGGLKQFKLDVGDVTVVNFNDPVLSASKSVGVFPEVVPGIWLYDNRTWAGLSIFHALGNNITDVGTDTRWNRHFLFSGGFQFSVGRKATLTPSTLLKFAAGVPPAFDLNAMLEFDKKVSIGATYRNVDAIAFLVKANAFKYFSFGYSYGITTSDLRVNSSNTHEIVVGISACPRGAAPRRAIFCPAFD